jgi:hypothetical protein
MFYTYQYMPLVKGPVYGFSDESAAQLEGERDRLQAAIAKLEPSAVVAVPVRPSVVIAKARAMLGSEPAPQIQYLNPGDASARVLVWEDRPGEVGADTGRLLMFDGVTGELLETSAALGSASYIEMGPVLRWFYFISGALGAAMIATGPLLWSAKRRKKLKPGMKGDFGFELVDRSNVGIICGLLIGVGVYFWANRLLPVGLAERPAWEMNCLFIAWGLAMLHALVRPSERAWTEQLALSAFVFGLLPLLNAVTTEIHLGNTLFVAPDEQDLTLASFDLVALAFGLVCGFLAWRRHVRRPAAGTAMTSLHPDSGEPQEAT